MAEKEYEKKETEQRHEQEISWEAELEEEESALPEEVGEVTRQTIFYLEPEWYAIDTELAEEVITVPSITYVPYTPHFVHGLINLRGTVVVVVDIREFFDLESITLKNESRVMIVKVGKKTTGILVDYVSDVLDIPVKDIQSPISTVKGLKAEFIKGQVKLSDGRFLILLDLEKVVASEKMQSISRKKGEVQHAGGK